MAKKKSTKKNTPEAKQLEFKDVFLEKKMHGQIKGIELPKLYKDFTPEEKLILYWHNPQKTQVLFKDVSFIGERKLENNVKEQEQENEQPTDEQAD